MWHLGVVLVDVEFDEGAEPLDRVQGVEVEPLVFERTPEGFEHRVREGDTDLGKHAVQTGGQQGVIHGGEDSGSTVELDDGLEEVLPVLLQGLDGDDRA